MATENEIGKKAFTAGSALEAYRRVKLNSSGQVVYAGAGEEGIGYTYDGPIASGDHVTVKLDGFAGTRKVVCAAAVTAGARLYGAASGKVDDAFDGRGPCVGIALEAGSADLSVIEMQPIEQGSQLLYSNLADSAAITNVTAETDFDKKLTIPAGEILEGDVYDVEAVVKFPSTNGTDTAALKLYFGTEVIIAPAAVDVANNDIGHIKARIAVRAGGAGGTVEATGTQAVGVPATVTAKPFNKAQAAEDLAVACDIKLSCTWSVANAGNQAVLEHLSIVRHRK